jgi:2,3-bisphosphoglycerate-dependent phosphoglycerate mutase
MVRHAESPYNEGTERTRGLTPKGKADIEKVTELLIDEEIDMVISSPYARAVLSVEELAKHLNIEVQLLEDLREFDFGTEMIGFEELMASISEGFKNPEYFLPGAESSAECQKRAIAILESVLNEHKGKKIAVGTHGLVMTLMMNYFDQAYDFDFLNQLSKPDIYKMEFEDLELKEVTRLWKE